MSAKQRSVVSAVARMGQFAGSSNGYVTGAKLLRILGAGPFFAGVEECEPSLILETEVAGRTKCVERQQLLHACVWVGFEENRLRLVAQRVTASSDELSDKEPLGTIGEAAVWALRTIAAGNHEQHARLKACY